MPKSPLYPNEGLNRRERAAAKVLAVVIVAIRFIQGEGESDVFGYSVLIHITDVFVLHPVYEV
jgi:hypothetical protein